MELKRAWLWGGVAVGLVLCSFLGAGLVRLDSELEKPPSLGTILDLELAFSPAVAQEILLGWDPGLRSVAQTALLLDLLFIPSYVLLLGSLLYLVLRWHRGAALTHLPTPVVWVLAAGAFDLVETLLLLRIVARGIAGWTVGLASTAAGFKFALVALASMVLLVLLVAVAVRRTRALLAGGEPEEGEAAADQEVAPSEIAYPDELRQRESALVRQRREALGDSGTVDADAPQGVGVALSGGGIRSATFCLGLFQALSRHELLRRVDFLSTVSGGGYFGAFLGRLLCRPEGPDIPQVEKVLAGQSVNGDGGQGPLRHLRENGRYLAPNGAGDLLLGGTVVLRNLVAVHGVLGLLVLTVFLGGLLIRARAEHSFSWLNALGPAEFWQLWSPWFVLGVAILAFWALPAGWGYWFVDRLPGRLRWLHGFSLVMVTFLGLVAISTRGSGEISLEGLLVDLEQPGVQVGLYLLVLGLLTAGFCWGARSRIRAPRPEQDSAVTTLNQELRQRNRLSRALKNALVVASAILLFGLLDALGEVLYLGIWTEKGHALPWKTLLGGLVSAIAAAGGFARRVVGFFSKNGSDRRPALPLKLMAIVAALALVLGILTALSTLSHAIAWGFREPSSVTATAGVRIAAIPPDRTPLLLGLAIAAVLAWSFGRSLPLLNRTSHHALYSARLARAYLGASNPERWSGSTGLTISASGDDLPWEEYKPHEKGGPLHLLNVTVNETEGGGRSQIQQQDRKGTGLAVGPCGLSVGVCDHLVLDEGWENPKVHSIAPARDPRVFKLRTPEEKSFEGEKLSLGKWVAISGAAFSTGTGYRTSLGLSLLAGLANVRLGYWWDPGCRQPPGLWSAPFPVQAHILRESLARFPGTSLQRWYLSDGGHFENLGAYELIRRRLPWMVVVDAAADPEYKLGDLAQLVRKARIDFGAEIRFLSEAELDRKIHPELRRYFGSLARLQRGRWSGGSRLEPEQADHRSFSLAHAALAEVTYEDEPQEPSSRWLLYLKPTLCGLEPTDVLEYHDQHPEFPQESTGDQFFDEAQWESYRKLGEHIGDRLFQPVSSMPGTLRTWTPRRLFGV